MSKRMTEETYVSYLESKGYRMDRMEAELILGKYPGIYILERNNHYYPVVIELGTVRFVKPSLGKSFKEPVVVEQSIIAGTIVDGKYIQPKECNGFTLYGYDQEENKKESDSAIMESYIIISSKELIELTKTVNKKMEHYVPIGGVCYDGTEYHQSMACKDFYMRDLTKQNEGGNDGE